MVKKLFQWAFDREKDDRLSLLHQVTLFKGLSRNLLMKLRVDLVEKEYQQGDLIFAEGDTGKALYIILNGSVSIAKRCGNENRVLADLSAGSFFGELALIDQVPRFASATAMEKTTLLIISIIAGQKLFGIMGMILAVPAVTILQKVVQIILYHRQRIRTRTAPAPHIQKIIV